MRSLNESEPSGVAMWRGWGGTLRESMRFSGSAVAEIVRGVDGVVVVPANRCEAAAAQRFSGGRNPRFERSGFECCVPLPARRRGRRSSSPRTNTWFLQKCAPPAVVPMTPANSQAMYSEDSDSPAVTSQELAGDPWVDALAMKDFLELRVDRGPML